MESLREMGPVRSLALEMAVTEELDRRELAGEAARLGDDSAEASEVAHIADNLFLPQAITDWIHRHRHRGRAVEPGR